MPAFTVLREWSEVDRYDYVSGFFLVKSNWDDFHYKTTFSLYYKPDYERFSEVISIGNIKIGYKDQLEHTWTFDVIPESFNRLSDDFFSLAESPDFYEALYSLGGDLCISVLNALNCIVLWDDTKLKFNRQDVLMTSLMRDVNINTIFGQFYRIVTGKDSKEKIGFSFIRDEKHNFSRLNLSFRVDHRSLPPSNVHAVIGRNGLGKTTLLNEMISSLAGDIKPIHAYFMSHHGQRIEQNYFSTVVSISFSAFDPFCPPEEQSDQKKGTCYYYIGLKLSDSERRAYNIKRNNENIYQNASARNVILNNSAIDELMPVSYLREKCAQSILRCFSNEFKKNLWLRAIITLESDYNFKYLNLTELTNLTANETIERAIEKMESMSSGHLVVFLTISRLVEVLQEKSLVIFDEPETHLHPPLLSAFIRTLSMLLTELNGVAILATHSPVVLQEVPSECSWVLRRFGDLTDYNRPSIETFAEDVGVITKEVFQLEAGRSGFIDLFKDKVSQNLSFEEILRDFSGNIGYEGKALLRSMIMVRDRKPSSRGKNA